MYRLYLYRLQTTRTYSWKGWRRRHHWRFSGPVGSEGCPKCRCHVDGTSFCPQYRLSKRTEVHIRSHSRRSSWTLHTEHWTLVHSLWKQTPAENYLRFLKKKTAENNVTLKCISFKTGSSYFCTCSSYKLKILQSVPSVFVLSHSSFKLVVELVEIVHLDKY